MNYKNNISFSAILPNINYWEFTEASAELQNQLNYIKTQGYDTIITFIPWQCMESDIHHKFTKFLQLVIKNHIALKVVITPEPGVLFDYTGFPKDLMKNKTILGIDESNHSYWYIMAPEAFEIPSFFSIDFEKRYTSFLSRLDIYFYDLLKLYPLFKTYITLVIGSSYWKLMRPGFFQREVFSVPSYDASMHFSIVYRKKIQNLLKDHEVTWLEGEYKNELGAFKKDYFFTYSEAQFRSRSAEIVQRRCGLPVLQYDTSVPEADPVMGALSFIQQEAHPRVIFLKCDEILEEYMLRKVVGAVPAVSWTSFGCFYGLTVEQKRFLWLKTILFCTLQKGSLIVGDEFFLFGEEVSAIQQFLENLYAQNLLWKPQVLYFSHHLWRTPLIWSRIRENLGYQAQCVNTIQSILWDYDILWVDEFTMVTQDIMTKLMMLVQMGKMVVFSNKTILDKSAQVELAQIKSSHECVHIHLKVPYEVVFLDKGKMVFFDPADIVSKVCVDDFIESVLKLADVKKIWNVSPSTKFLALEDDIGGKSYLFFMNDQEETKKVRIAFDKKVQWSWIDTIDYRADHHFEAELAPYTIQAIAVQGMSYSLMKEASLAEAIASNGTQNAQQIAQSQLPGFIPDASLEEGGLWNL